MVSGFDRSFRSRPDPQKGFRRPGRAILSQSFRRVPDSPLTGPTAFRYSWPGGGKAVPSSDLPTRPRNLRGIRIHRNGSLWEGFLSQAYEIPAEFSRGALWKTCAFKGDRSASGTEGRARRSDGGDARALEPDSRKAAKFHPGLRLHQLALPDRRTRLRWRAAGPGRLQLLRPGLDPRALRRSRSARGAVRPRRPHPHRLRGGFPPHAPAPAGLPVERTGGGGDLGGRATEA